MDIQEFTAKACSCLSQQHCEHSTQRSLFFSPLQLRMAFQVKQQSIFNPMWRISFIADIASEAVEVVLLETSRSHPLASNEGRLSCLSVGDPDKLDNLPCDLETGRFYSILVHVPYMKEKIGSVKEKYLQQISTIKIEVVGLAQQDKASEVLKGDLNIVCQAMPCASLTGEGTLDINSWIRQIYSPLS